MVTAHTAASTIILGGKRARSCKGKQTLGKARIEVSETSGNSSERVGGPSPFGDGLEEGTGSGAEVDEELGVGGAGDADEGVGGLVPLPLLLRHLVRRHGVQQRVV